jgi:cbb3-type cytochrome oxidase subunit 3
VVEQVLAGEPLLAGTRPSSAGSCAMTERFAYVAFLTVVGVGLTVMTLCLAAVGFFLLRRNRRESRRSATDKG